MSDPDATRRPRLAYLVSEYPTISHTFILREIEALRKLGFHIAPCSIRRTDPVAHHRGAAEKAAAAETFYVIAAARNPFHLIVAQIAVLARPGRWWRAVRLAWETAPPGLKGGLWQLFYFIEAAVLARHMQQRSIDHLHNHFGASSCTVAMLASALSGIPYSFTLHGPLVFFEAHHWRLDAKIRQARFVACISYFCRSQAMLLSNPAGWNKLRIIHCGVDPDRYRRADRPEGGKRILFVGRLAAMKGVPVLLRAVAQVRTRYPDLHLTLIGDGPERPQIEALTRHLGLAECVEFAGYRDQDEVAAALAETDIFALPSFAEGLPVVLMEAMAAGVPVVATRIAGISELVEDGVSGRIAHASDVRGFATALEGLLADPAAAQRMGHAGRATVARAFSSDGEAIRLAALYDRAGQGGFGTDDRADS
ncbi:MAG: glycosyltransferase family 4 protein [Qingshengfaniella sp.]